jgi:hypothetical protein
MDAMKSAIDIYTVESAPTMGAILPHKAGSGKQSARKCPKSNQTHFM